MAMNAGYASLVLRERPPKHQGFFLSAEEVEEWASSGSVSDELLSFLRDGILESQHVFVYTHTHSGSGMDDPTAKVVLDDGVLTVTWFDRATSCVRTCDLCFRPILVAIRFDQDIAQSIHAKGLQIQEHTFVVGGVTDEARAFATLRGIGALKDKNDTQLKTLTSVSTEIADASTLQALAYLPDLEELQTRGVNWAPGTLDLLGNLVTLKKLRVGGRYWAEKNNFTYPDLEYLTGLTKLESLDLSYSAVDGSPKAGRFSMLSRDEQPSEKELARVFARGMKTILKFPSLKALILETEMYPKGAKVLTSHPNLQAILAVRNLSYEVVHNLANSRLAAQLTDFDFEYARTNQLAAPIVGEIAKFVNLTHLGMRHVDTLNDAAMAELAPLVNLKELYVPVSRITSEGLKVLRQMPELSVLSLGYCSGIENGLDHITHLPLTHLDVRSIKGLTAAHLVRVIRASPNLVDLNLRYAESVDAKTIAKEEFKELKFLNTLSLGGDSQKAEKALRNVGAKFYYEDDPFHILPVHLVDRQ